MKMRTYKTYRFINKDPVIDVLRTAIQDEAAARSVTFKTMLGILENESHVSVGCLQGWFKGGTKKPQNATLMAVAIAIGPRGRKALSNFIMNVGGEDKIIPFRQRAAHG